MLDRKIQDMYSLKRSLIYSTVILPCYHEKQFYIIIRAREMYAFMGGGMLP